MGNDQSLRMMQSTDGQPHSSYSYQSYSYPGGGYEYGEVDGKPVIN